jgi:hypothetical protein
MRPVVGGLYGALTGDSDVVVVMLETETVKRVRACIRGRCGCEIFDVIS